MTQKVIILIIGLAFTSCQERKVLDSDSGNIEMPIWNIGNLNKKAAEQLDSSKWDLPLFKQDIETNNKYPEVFQNYPINKSPFPVAEYEYAVSYIPFTMKMEGKIFKGVRIGECEDFDCEKETDKLTLLVLTNDENAEEITLVDSRNYPYLTAQGMFKVANNEFDWVFAASPDGFSNLLINMKFFDLRFGETILIYPQTDKSFFYDQIKESSNNYDNFEEFKKIILNNDKVKNQLKSKGNINLKR
jgi:hypothetical protein